MRKSLTLLAVIALVVAIGIGVATWLSGPGDPAIPGAPGEGKEGGGHLAEQPEWCPAVEVIAVPGTAESRVDDNPEAPTANPNSLILGVTSQLQQSYSADDVKVWTTPYPAEIRSHQAPQLMTYNESQAVGRDVITKEMSGLHSQCPLTKFVLMGFSQGSSIAGDMAEQIGAGNGPVPEDRVAGVALLGDPRRDPGQGVNQGVPLGGVGIELALQPFDAIVQAAMPGATMRGPRAGFGPLNDRVQNICVPGDSFCDAPPNLPDIIARGPGLFASAGAHGTYAFNTEAIPGTTPVEWTINWAKGLIDAAVNA